MQLNLLVLRCQNIEISKKFYEKLGLEFIKEQHGKGVKHYATYVGSMVMELYPLIEKNKIENIRLGFSLESKYMARFKDEIISQYMFGNQNIIVIEDPDGRKIELIGE